MRGVSPDGRNTVQGTFDDLSEEEKTRAYLQFLQYHQQVSQHFNLLLANDYLSQPNNYFSAISFPFKRELVG